MNFKRKILLADMQAGDLIFPANKNKKVYFVLKARRIGHTFIEVKYICLGKTEISMFPAETFSHQECTCFTFGIIVR